MTRDKVTELYRNWRKSHGNKRPRFAIVRMYWEDESPEHQLCGTISLNFKGIDDDDENILFYARGLKGLWELTKPNNGSDFVVTEVLSFAK